MEVYVNTVAGAPDFAALPAGKIIRYPLEKRDYRPFAQAQFALSEEALSVRLTAFESQPDPRSTLMLALEGAGKPVAVACRAPAEGETAPPREMGEGECLKIGAAYLSGEDLQGKYWGVTLTLPRRELEQRIGYRLAAGGVLRGNVYKILSGAERAHCGCLFESRVVWSVSDAEKLTAEDFGALSVVGY